MNRARKSNYIQFNDCKSEHPDTFGTNMFNHKQMKKLFFILLLTFIFWGCDEVEEGLIDPNEEIFLVESLAAPTTLKYFGTETKLTTSISFSDSKSILKTWVNIDSQDGTVNVAYRKEMAKSGENEYSISIPMEEDMPSLTYTIDYYFQTAIQAEKKIASHNFEYDNNQNNVAPVLSDPDIPDQINRDENFSFSVRVADENGYDDVNKVFYELFRPNGDQIKNSEGIEEFPMFDDGDTAKNGDLIAGDSIYTVLLMFPSSAESGSWKFELKADDRNGALSNTITHNLVVK